MGCAVKKTHHPHHHHVIPPHPTTIISPVTKKETSPSCPVCYEPLTDDLFTTTCGCYIHRECFRQLIYNNVASIQYPIKCPYYNCGSVIELVSLGQFLSGEELVPLLDLAFLYYSLDDVNEIIRCPRQCGFAVSWDRKSPCKEFTCLLCNERFCSDCFKEFHEHDCEPIPHAFKRCKMCSNLIERYEGCNNVTCRCGYQFCWKCNSPKGCKCSPGHGYYAVDKVIANWGNSTFYICNCKGPICKCRPKV